MSDLGGPLDQPFDVPEPVRIPEPPGGFPPGRKPKKSEQGHQSRLSSRLARLPVASLIRAGIVIVVAAIVVIVIVIVVFAVQQH
jgi:hypothetical protein